ncbi:putative flippase GtrA [Arthrobacter sp. PL16]|jgi:putative flippase GtrA|uniref:GtrA family protein n=1 Tax=Arthrobacter cheniae TaxID=1258888 RepID=A0A3A5LZN2_9MICC|nr:MULTISPECIES: GtrA family protein [Arthrobacter]MEC5198041.1 putative flippase GtrA [Arthrobacter sp. PL16]RJT78260.1 GtrA family protein [Arthrobacter cheniae]
MEHDSPQRADGGGAGQSVQASRRGEALRFLFVGGLSFLIDFGLLVLLHEVLDLGLIIATPAAFLTSLVANYALQRRYAFKATTGLGPSAVKYLAAVAFNTVAASLIVAGSEQIGLGYQVGKVLSTALMTVWNFFLYKHWIFRRVVTTVG